MAAIKLIVKSTEKQRLASIYLRFVNGRQVDIVTAIPIKVYPEYWSNVTESFKQRIVYNDVFTEKEKNDTEADLRALKDFVLKQFNEIARSGVEPTKEWLKSVIDKHYNKESAKQEDLNQYIERFIKEIESGDRTYNHNNDSKRYELGTIKNFKGFKAQFDAYQKDKKVKLNFNSITIDFYDEFVRFFVKKDYSLNTIGRMIKNLKTLMRLSMDEGLHLNAEVNRKKFKVMKTPVENIYLSESEVNSIRELELSDNRVLDVARDVFLIGVYTAQRFSDFSRITPDNIKTLGGVRVIDIIQQKTRERVIIPIKPELDRILKKYNYHVPKTWEQKVNLHIKTVGGKAKITEMVETEKIKGGFKIKSLVPKNDLIKTHTARRTGCTLMYLAGIPAIDIMKISGHKTEREFLNYIKVSKEETAINLSLHPYFVGNVLSVVK